MFSNCFSGFIKSFMSPDPNSLIIGGLLVLRASVVAWFCAANAHIQVKANPQIPAAANNQLVKVMVLIIKW